MKLPRPLPHATPLCGRYVNLLAPDAAHCDDLYAASGDAQAAQRFRYLFEEAPVDRAAMACWIDHAKQSRDPLYFVVQDTHTKKILGRQALMRITPEHGVIEIGSIYWGPEMARTRRATEAFYLHAKYCFDDLGYRRFEWKCNNLNEPSKKAAHRFGFQFEGVFRQHMWTKGQNRDTAWFAIIDADWPALKTEFERWLAPDNFTEDEKQKTVLKLTAP